MFDFESNKVVEDIATVPEKYQGLYAQGEGENEGKFVLSDAAQGIVADYVGANKALEGARHDKKKASDESAQRRLTIQAVEDLASSMGIEIGDDGAAAAFETFIKDLQEQVKGGKQLKVDMDKIKQEHERRLQEGLSAKDKELEEMRNSLSNSLISDKATAALAKHKGSVDLLLPHVKSKAEVVREEDGSYSVRVLDNDGSHRSNGSGGWMGIDELVTEMKGQDAFARAFESETPSGSGSSPGSFKNAPPRQQQELSATDKIKAGLAKQQHSSGRGA